MRAVSAAALAAACILIPTAGSAGGDDRVVRRLEGTFATRGAERIRVDLPPGQFRIEPSPDDQVRVDVSVRCDDRDDREDREGREGRRARRCRERAADFELSARTVGGTFRLRIEGFPSVLSRGLSLDGVVAVPGRAALGLEMGAGSFTVTGHRGDLELDLGAGEVKVRMRERDVRSVAVQVGVGEGRLTIAGRAIEGKGWLGNSVRWNDGPGRSRISVNLGAGDAAVRLE